MNGARLMNSSRITLTLGAAGGGLLAAAFLQTAVAFADTTGLVSPVGPSPSPTEVFNFEPTGSETVTSSTDDLPFYETSTGTQDFDVIDTSITGDPTVGTFDATVTDTDILGVTNVEDVVTSDLIGTTGDPTVGSIYDTTTFDSGGFENIFTEIPSATAGGAPTLTDIFATPFGDYTLPPALDTILADILGTVGADGATAATGAADTAGTSALDGLTGLLGLF
jgi:hypothetical protein